MNLCLQLESLPLILMFIDFLIFAGDLALVLSTAETWKSEAKLVELVLMSLKFTDWTSTWWVNDATSKHDKILPSLEPLRETPAEDIVNQRGNPGQDRSPAEQKRSQAEAK